MQQKRRNLLQENDNDSNECRRFNMEIEKRVLERLGFYLGDLISTNLLISNFIENGGFTIATNSNNGGGHGNEQQQRLLLTAAHRDIYLALAYSLPQTLVYFGLEDGTCVGNYWDYGYYREPGNAGYVIINNDNDNDTNDHDNNATTVNPGMQKHWKSCINSTTGEPLDCVLPLGDLYIQCSHTSDDEISENEQQAEAASGLCNAMELCPDKASQRDCSPLLQQQQHEQQQNDKNTTTNTTNTTNEYQACMAAKKWCRQYSIETATTAENSNTTLLGMIPLTNYCMDKHGQFTQTMGKVYTPLRGGPYGSGKCYYLNEKTLVQRHNISGDYAYCQRQQQQVESISNNNACMEENNNDATLDTTQQQQQQQHGLISMIVCNDTFAGGFESNNYDPRYRPWYSSTKELQMPNWSLYPFFALGLGITYSYPIYQTTLITTNDEQEEKQVFAGVLAIDYRSTCHVSQSSNRTACRRH